MRATGAQYAAQVADLILEATVSKAGIRISIIGFQVLSAHTHNTFDTRQRNCVRILSNLYQQSLVQGQRKGKPYGKRSASERLRIDMQRTTQLLDFTIDNVHTDTAPCNLRHFLCSTESRFQDKLEYLVISQIGIRFHQATLDGLAAYGIHLDAGAIVGDTQNHIGRFTLQCNFYGSAFLLTGLLSLFREFYSVGDRISQHVLDRCDYTVYHGAIHFTFRTG